MQNRGSLRGFTRRNLFLIWQLFDAYADDKKVSPLVTQLPWTYNLACFEGIGNEKPTTKRTKDTKKKPALPRNLPFRARVYLSVSLMLILKNGEKLLKSTSCLFKRLPLALPVLLLGDAP